MAIVEQSKAAHAAATAAAALARPDEFKPVRHGNLNRRESSIMPTRTFFSRYAAFVVADWGAFGALAASITGRLYFLDREVMGNFYQDAENVYEVTATPALLEQVFAPHRDTQWWCIPLPPQNPDVLVRQRAIEEKPFPRGTAASQKPKKKKSRNKNRRPAIGEAVR